jgi:dihydrofolate reductase
MSDQGEAMRKLIVLSFITLDGVMQAVGGPEEDPSGGFQYGGWVGPYNDEFSTLVLAEQIGHPFDLLLGRKTYAIWVGYWPLQDEKTAPFAAEFNHATKYVVSHSQIKLDWKNSVLIQGDVVGEIQKLKAQDGPELQVWGSGNLIQTLLKHNLIDEMLLWIFPITIGSGKRLFAEGTIPANFKLLNSKTSSTGVIIATLQPGGELKTGTFAMDNTKSSVRS